MVVGTEDVPTGENLILSALFEKEGDGTRRAPPASFPSTTTADTKVGEGTIKTQLGAYVIAGAARWPPTGRAVTDDYPGDSPYAFTGGTINRVAVDVSGDPYVDLEREAEMLIRSQEGDSWGGVHAVTHVPAHDRDRTDSGGETASLTAVPPTSRREQAARSRFDLEAPTLRSAEQNDRCARSQAKRVGVAGCMTTSRPLVSRTSSLDGRRNEGRAWLDRKLASVPTRPRQAAVLIAVVATAITVARAS